MNVTATRREIEDTKILLDMLETWETLSQASGQYNHGRATLRTEGNCGKAEWSGTLDVYNRRDSGVVEITNTQICRIVGEAMAEASHRVIELIKKTMPIQVN